MNVYLRRNEQWQYFENVSEEELNKSGVTLGDGVTLGYGVKLGDMVKLGNCVTLGDMVKLGNCVTLGDGVTLGDEVKLGDWVKLGDMVKLGNCVTLGDEVKLGDWVKLGPRDILMIGPQGSRNSMLWSYVHGGNLIFGTGCFLGTIEEFEKRVKETHGENEHAKEYARVLEFVRGRFLCPKS